MSFPNPLTADTFFAPFEKIGRAVMDLGFGGFLEKFEDHFGRGLTKALLILIGLAVAAMCGSVIWTYLLKPIAELLPDPGNRSSEAYQFAKLTLIVALFLMITNQLISLADNYLKRGIRRQMREKVAEAQLLADRAEKNLAMAQAAFDRAEQASRETGDVLAEAGLLVEHVLSSALEQGLITQQQADELRALRDDEPTNVPEA